MAAPRSSGYLREQLERPLGGAKVRHAQRHVRSDHADQRYAVDVVSLGDHLRANEYIEFAFIQRIQRALEIFLPAHGVAIKPRDARLRKHAVQQLLQLFGSCSEKINVLAAAMRASLRHRGHVAAVVAYHAMLALMMRERDGTVPALRVSCRRCGTAPPANSRGG